MKFDLASHVAVCRTIVVIDGLKRGSYCTNILSKRYINRFWFSTFNLNCVFVVFCCIFIILTSFYYRQKQIFLCTSSKFGSQIHVKIRLRAFRLSKSTHPVDKVWLVFSDIEVRLGSISSTKQSQRVLRAYAAIALCSANTRLSYSKYFNFLCDLFNIICLKV